MLSKFLRPTYKSNVSQLLLRRVSPKIAHARYVDFIPATQYDTPFPKKFKPGYTLTTYWEIIPLIFCTSFALVLMFFSIFWAVGNKVDVVFTTHNRQTIGRTMDLRNPTVHKLFTINQRYEPWPEMQDVLDKMTVAERRALARAHSCSHP